MLLHCPFFSSLPFDFFLLRCLCFFFILLSLFLSLLFFSCRCHRSILHQLCLLSFFFIAFVSSSFCFLCFCSCFFFMFSMLGRGFVFFMLKYLKFPCLFSAIIIRFWFFLFWFSLLRFCSSFLRFCSLHALCVCHGLLFQYACLVTHACFLVVLLICCSQMYGLVVL